MTTAPAAQAAQQQGPLPNSGDSSRCSSGANLARRILTQYLVVRLAMIAISFWRDPVKAREQFPFVARFLGTPNTESEQQAEEQQGVGESDSEDGVDDKSRKFREGETLYTNCLEVGDKIVILKIGIKFNENLSKLKLIYVFVLTIQAFKKVGGSANINIDTTEVSLKGD